MELNETDKCVAIGECLVMGKRTKIGKCIEIGKQMYCTTCKGGCIHLQSCVVSGQEHRGWGIFYPLGYGPAALAPSKSAKQVNRGTKPG